MLNPGGAAAAAASPGAGADGGPMQSIKNAYAKWYHETPAITRCMVVIGVAGTLMTILEIDRVLGLNAPYYSILRLQLWRIFTAGFIGRSLLSDLFALFSLYQICLTLERSKGSMFIVMATVPVTIFIQFISVMLLTLAGTIFSTALYMFFGGGYWPLAFVFIAMECGSSADATRQFMCFPVEVPTKLYPVILAVLFFIFSGGRSIDIFVGLGLGTLAGKYPALQLSSIRCRQMESKPIMKSICDMNGYISVDGIGYLINDEERDSSLDRTGSSPSRQALRPFSGVGHKLGSLANEDCEPIEGAVFRPAMGHPLADRYPKPESFSGMHLSSTPSPPRRPEPKGSHIMDDIELH